MPQVIRKKLNLLPLVNGVKFEAFGDYSLSEEISDETAAEFLAHEGYELHGDEGNGGDENTPPPPPAPEVKETAAQRKARLKAEQEAAEKEEAERKAAEEEAARLAAEQANANNDAGNGEGENSEVF